MRFQAMHDFTARLPRVEPAERINLYGRTTEDAMRSGTTAGLVEEVRGLIRRFRRSFPGLHVILTGGDGFFVKTT